MVQTMCMMRAYPPTISKIHTTNQLSWVMMSCRPAATVTTRAVSPPKSLRWWLWSTTAPTTGIVTPALMPTTSDATAR